MSKRRRGRAEQLGRVARLVVTIAAHVLGIGFLAAIAIAAGSGGKLRPRGTEGDPLREAADRQIAVSELEVRRMADAVARGNGNRTLLDCLERSHAEARHALEEAKLNMARVAQTTLHGETIKRLHQLDRVRELNVAIANAGRSADACAAPEPQPVVQLQ